jgi:hypothetical protein
LIFSRFRRTEIKKQNKIFTPYYTSKKIVKMSQRKVTKPAKQNQSANDAAESNKFFKVLLIATIVLLVIMYFGFG